MDIDRRTVLAALATAGGASLLASVGANRDDEAVSLGGNSRESTGAAYTRGSFSTAPQTRPPADSDDDLVWMYGDDIGVGEIRGPDPLPASWSSNGINFAAAGDLSTARSNAPAPGIAMVFEQGTGFFEVQAPDQDEVIKGDIEVVMASTLDDAKSLHTGAVPAVLFGLDGAGEVVLP